MGKDLVSELLKLPEAERVGLLEVLLRSVSEPSPSETNPRSLFAELEQEKAMLASNPQSGLNIEQFEKAVLSGSWKNL